MIRRRLFNSASNTIKELIFLHSPRIHVTNLTIWYLYVFFFSKKHFSSKISEQMAKLDERIGFIGGGNMAYAIGSGLINRGIVKSTQVLVSGPNIENLERWRVLGATVTDENNEVRVFFFVANN